MTCHNILGFLLPSRLSKIECLVHQHENEGTASIAMAGIMCPFKIQSCSKLRPAEVTLRVVLLFQWLCRNYSSTKKKTIDSRAPLQWLVLKSHAWEKADWVKASKSTYNNLHLDPLTFHHSYPVALSVYSFCSKHAHSIILFKGLKDWKTQWISFLLLCNY